MLLLNEFQEVKLGANLGIVRLNWTKQEQNNLTITHISIRGVRGTVVPSMPSFKYQGDSIVQKPTYANKPNVSDIWNLNDITKYNVKSPETTDRSNRNSLISIKTKSCEGGILHHVYKIDLSKEDTFNI